MAQAISNFFNYLNEINFWHILLRVVLALIMGGIIGMERGKQGRAAGMRTHILVCLGAALTAMTGQFAYTTLGYLGDPLRVAAQVISGIGFLGVGTILIKGRFQITGLTTAAGLWAAATIGIALGIGFYLGAVLAFLATVLTMTFMHRFEYRVTHKNTRFGIYLEIRGTDDVRKLHDHLMENYRVSDIQVTPPRTGLAGNVGIEAVVHAYDDDKINPDLLARKLEELPEVTEAKVSHKEGTAVVVLASDLSDDVLKKTVEDQGYKVL